MNANELAEIIEHLENARYIGASKASEMLRQQQAEIEALKQSKSDGNNKVNSKPVAWAVWEDNVHDMFFTKEEADELCRLKGGDAKSVPLYTHLVKELTNKEILEEWDWDSGEILATDLLDFADAILRKAQE